MINLEVRIIIILENPRVISPNSWSFHFQVEELFKFIGMKILS